ncbi:MAG TPA: BlaI/MecI/CopY family transcriptional regulator [Ktedonobacterales bacterium]|nr:BlaI/MecI/CopY family transcriptional regulator [Ktedonobacterales bacterium]
MRTERTQQPGHPLADESAAVRAFQLDSTGLRCILGSLEADLLEAVWHLTPGPETAAAGWTTIGAVCAHLGPSAKYKTVQTVMNRMVEKGLLLRRQDARAHTYRAGMTHDALVMRVTHAVVSSLVREFGMVAVDQLVSTLHAVSPEHIAELDALAAAPSPGVSSQTGPSDTPHALPPVPYRDA